MPTCELLLHVRPGGCGKDLQRLPHKPAASTLSFHKIGFVQLGADITLVVQMLSNAFKSGSDGDLKSVNTMVCIAQGDEQTAPRIR
jgi:hypothetical protein